MHTLVLSVSLVSVCVCIHNTKKKICIKDNRSYASNEINLAFRNYLENADKYSLIIKTIEKGFLGLIVRIKQRKLD